MYELFNAATLGQVVGSCVVQIERVGGFLRECVMALRRDASLHMFTTIYGFTWMLFDMAECRYTIHLAFCCSDHDGVVPRP